MELAYQTKYNKTEYLTDLFNCDMSQYMPSVYQTVVTLPGANAPVASVKRVKPMNCGTLIVKHARKAHIIRPGMTDRKLN